MIIATNNKPIAEMTNESRFKDAHLIAAAPDLLEALEKAYEVMKVQAVTKGCQVRMSHALELSEKAIAKARGQS
jgi:nitrate reductase alpha subunit